MIDDDTPVTALQFDTKHLRSRVLAILGYSKIMTVGDLLEVTLEELMRLPNFGRLSARAVLKSLELAHDEDDVRRDRLVPLRDLRKRQNKKAVT
jgi:DNA-directed RNA polymerase alpha subunit